jgi:uncharacterized membrane protein
MNPRELHPVSKVIVMLIIGVAVFAAVGAGTGMFSTSTVRMPRSGMGAASTDLLSGDVLLAASAAGVSLAVMLAASILLFNWRPGHSDRLAGGTEGRTGNKGQPAPKDEFSIIKRALTDDETSLLEKVREVPGGVTQDSLRFRLGWSKAKISTMLTNLDRMGLVQRERFGKTYKVHYQEGGKDQ